MAGFRIFIQVECDEHGGLIRVPSELSMEEALALIERESGITLKETKQGYVGQNGEMFKQRLCRNPIEFTEFIKEVGAEKILRKAVEALFEQIMPEDTRVLN
jgi:hypothetical protein